MLRVKRFAICFAFIVVASAGVAQAQSLPKVRAAYTSIGIQFDPVYIMKEFDLPRKYGLDVEMLFVPVSSRAVQAALAGEIAVYHQWRRGQYQRECDGRRFHRTDGDAQYVRIQDHCEPGTAKA